MKYLVLGSSGQVGKPLCEYLEDKGNEVICYDIKRTVLEDLRNYDEKLIRIMSDVDFVYFLAWDVGGSKYLLEKENTYQFINNNVFIMVNTFDALNITKKPFIFISSQMSLILHSSYGNLKMLGEKYTKSLDGLAVRLWNVYGEEHEEEKSHVITDFIRMAKEENKIYMRTTGKEERQFLYAKDCSEVLYLLSQKYNFFRKILSCIDISSFEWTSVEDIAKIVSDICGCSYDKGTIEDKIQDGHKCDPDPFILNYWKPKINLYNGIRLLFDKK